jgi:hypothetical protein
LQRQLHTSCIYENDETGQKTGKKLAATLLCSKDSCRHRADGQLLLLLL